MPCLYTHVAYIYNLFWNSISLFKILQTFEILTLLLLGQMPQYNKSFEKFWNASVGVCVRSSPSRLRTRTAWIIIGWGKGICAVNVECHDTTLKRVTTMPLIWFQTADAFTATNFYVSSESSSSGSLSSASDGVYPNVHSSCAKTNVEANPWFAVDMGAVFIIQRVFLYKAEKGKDCGQLQFCVYSFSLKLIRLNHHDSSARAGTICDRTPQELCTWIALCYVFLWLVSWWF